MTLRRPLVPALLATAFTVALAAGCSGSGNGTTMAQLTRVANLETTNLTVAAVPTTDSTGLYVAEYEGLFAKVGLNVKIEPAISAEQSVNQLALGKINVLAGNYVSFIEAQDNWDNGTKPIDVANPTDKQIAANLDLFAEASVEQPGFVGLFTLPGSTIKSVSQLKGKLIGINAPDNVAYLLTASFLVANNINPADVHFVTYPFPLMLGELQKHKIDAAFLAEPFISTADESAGVSQLTNLDAGSAAGLPIEGYATTKGFAKANPNTMAAFEQALQEGQNTAATNRGIAEKAMVQYGLLPSMPPGTPVQAADQIATLLQFETYPLSPVDATRIKRVADLMQSFGLLGSFNINRMLGD